MCFVHWNTFILKPTGFQELLSFINKGFFFILFSAGFSKNRRQNTYRFFFLKSIYLIFINLFFCIRQTLLNFWKFHFLLLSQKTRCISHFFDKIKVLRVGLKIGHAILQGGSLEITLAVSFNSQVSQLLMNSLCIMALKHLQNKRVKLVYFKTRT